MSNPNTMKNFAGSGSNPRWGARGMKGRNSGAIAMLNILPNHRLLRIEENEPLANEQF